MVALNFRHVVSVTAFNYDLQNKTIKYVGQPAFTVLSEKEQHFPFYFVCIFVAFFAGVACGYLIGVPSREDEDRNRNIWEWLALVNFLRLYRRGSTDSGQSHPSTADLPLSPSSPSTPQQQD